MGVLDAIKDKVAGEVAKPAGPPHWQTELCQCTDDVPVCGQTLCCFYCTAANMINMFDHHVAAFDCLSCVAVMAGDYFYYSYFKYAFAISTRRTLVQRYGIRGENVCKSCLLGVCCMPCTVCQVQREMAKREEHPGGCCATPPAEQPGFGDKMAGVLKDQIASGRNKPWGSTICQCEPVECVETCFCGPCIYGFMSNRLDAGNVDEKPVGHPNAMDPATCCAAWLFPLGMIYANRREVVQRYSIIGETHIMSCVMAIFCGCCSTMQQRREMGYNNEWPGGICVKDPPSKPQNAPNA